MSKKVFLYFYKIPFLLINYIYKIINRNKKRILIYTDSRGIEITKKSNRRNPFSSYIGYFLKKYNVDYVLMPEDHTTIIDFLYAWHLKYKQKDYDIIIIHLGIVDFSPRPETMLKKIRQIKNAKIVKLFNKDINQVDKLQISDVIYEGEYTSSIYSESFLNNYILKELKLIRNLIYIGTNSVLDDWNGNYHKKRPQNINSIMSFNTDTIHSLSNSIDISEWSEAEIKRYTVDNIHLSKLGFKYLQVEIENKIEEIT